MGLFSIFQKADTLYYPGCVTYFKFKENFELYKKIFSKLSIKITELDEHICCGLLALELGYEAEARKLARRNFELLKEKGIKRIITNCPSCYKMFTQDYPKLLPDWDIEVENTWKLIFEELASKTKLIKKITEELITYHDSCYLGRYCGIYDEPRKILELIGYTIEEIHDSRENSMCCGSCGGLVMINPELADKIAKQRLLQARRKGIKKMVVASLQNYGLLKKNAGDLGIEILELSEVLAKALGIKISEKTETKEENEEELTIDLGSDENIKEDENETKGKLKPKETEGVLGKEDENEI